MRIYLIGMPGSGKSSVGKYLAEKLNYRFLDLDLDIEKRSLMFIPEIIKGYGEETFRKKETEALSLIHEDNLVVSTGGGIVTVKENRSLMQGVKVFLNTDLDLIRERIKNDPPRPLLETKTLEELMQERLLKYLDFADEIVDNDGDLIRCTNQILSRLKEKYTL